MSWRQICTVLTGMWLALAAPTAMAAPGLYVVELKDAPAVELAMREARPQRAARAERPRLNWRRHVPAVRSRQESLRQQVEQRGAAVLGAVSITANALFVEMDDGRIQEIASLPGIRRVRPVREYRMTMDAAIPLHKIPEAWELAGGQSRAGEGVKIAVIDSGIEVSHPAFNADGFSLPAGFPKTNFSLDETNTSAKVIVARSYVPYLRYWDPDPSVKDHVGHGTAVAMVAAGVPHEGPMGWVSGVAPRAWIGVYKVFGTPGYNDTTNDFALQQAIEDAVSDGMDILNLSLGLDISLRLEKDTLAQAVENAAATGVIVVVSAGNNGPGWNSIASPATAPSAISVGASTNSRTFGYSLRFDHHDPVLGVPGTGPVPSEAVTAEIADIAAVDESRLACSPLPEGSLAGRIALILRGTCTFETKLNNARAAGAVGAVVQAREESPDPVSMSVGAATLPAMMISWSNGEKIRGWLADEGTVVASMDFTYSRVAQQPGLLAGFSARGPNVDLGIKPDLIATGTDLWIATQTLDPYGQMYDPSGYTLVDGTSFSAPFVTGAAAVVRSAHPSLDAAAVRSALIHSAAPMTDEDGSWIQRSGAGLLDLESALRAPLTVSDISLSFGSAAPGTAPEAKSLTLSSRSDQPETWFIRVEARRGAVSPVVSADQIELAPGGEAQLQVNWPEAPPESGTYEGFVVLEGSSSGRRLRVPYWFAASTGEPASYTVLDQTTQARRGRTVYDAILFRVVDANGVPSSHADVAVEALDAGTVISVDNYDGDSPGVYGISVRLGLVAGANRFRIRAGGVEFVYTITGY